MTGDMDVVRLIKQQLAKDLDNYCTPLGMWGIRGALFKLTLFSYGYTFVGKGTTDRLWTDVRAEADVYRALQKAQGSAVPVFLGTIDLKMTYFLEGGACIKHMLLMSWGDELWEEIRRSEHEIRELGVQIYIGQIFCGIPSSAAFKLLTSTVQSLSHRRSESSKRGMLTCNEADWCQGASRLRRIRLLIGVW
ncbi:hypothetical protein V1520DRAFT_350694 [Lipomyces starkeyi]